MTTASGRRWSRSLKNGPIWYKSEHYWAHWTSAYNGKSPSTYLLSCTCINALRRSTFCGTPSFYWPTPSFYWKFWYSPYWIYKSYWV